MKLTDEQRLAVEFAISTVCTPMELDDFFEKIDPYISPIAGENEQVAFDLALDYARRKNTWSKDPTVLEVKRLASKILWFKDKEFYRKILNLFEETHEITRDVPVDPASQKQLEAFGKLNNSKELIQGVLGNLKIRIDNFTAESSKELITVDDLTNQASLLEKAIQGLIQASGVFGATPSGTKRNDVVLLDSVIQEYQDPDHWLKFPADQLLEEARNQLQSFQQINKAMNQINQAIIEYPFFSVYSVTDKTEMRVIDHSYVFSEGKVQLTVMNNEGKLFEKFLITGRPENTEKSSEIKQPAKSHSDSSSVGFTSWK